MKSPVRKDTAEWWCPFLGTRTPDVEETRTIWEEIRTASGSSLQAQARLTKLLHHPLPEDVLTAMVASSVALLWPENVALYLEQEHARGALRWAALKGLRPGEEDHWKDRPTPGMPSEVELIIARSANAGWNRRLTRTFLPVAEELAQLTPAQIEILAALLSDLGGAPAAPEVHQTNFRQRLQVAQRV